MSFHQVFHRRDQRYHNHKNKRQIPILCGVPMSLKRTIVESKNVNKRLSCDTLSIFENVPYCQNIRVPKELVTLDDIISHASSVFESINTNEMLTICFSKNDTFVKCVLIEMKNNSTIRSLYTLCSNYTSKNLINKYMTNILENYLYTQRCIELLNKVRRDVRIIYDANHTVMNINKYRFSIDKSLCYKIHESINGQSYNTFEEFANFVYSNLVQQSGDSISLRFVE